MSNNIGAAGEALRLAKENAERATRIDMILTQMQRRQRFATRAMVVFAVVSVALTVAAMVGALR